MAIADDFSVAINGDIRYTGLGVNYTVLAFHRYLGGLADDAQAAGNDLVDITTATPSDRSTDNIITLNAPFNIDDTAAEHLFDGSVTQKGGDEQYSGLEVVGTVVTGTVPCILQDNKFLPAYWGTGINVDAASLVIMRILVKSRTGGAEIDGKRILVIAREFGDQYKEFPTTLGLGSSVAAISTADDLNNAKSDTIIAAMTSITNVEGKQDLNIDGTGAAGQSFYSQWNKGTQSLNDVFERGKWIGQRSHTAASGTDTGTNYVVDNATIVGQGQEFIAQSFAEKITEVRFRCKIGGGVPVGTLVCELIDSNSAATAIPQTPFTVLATSEAVLVSRLTATYQEMIFTFNDNISLNASQDYFVVIRNAAATSANFVHVEGAAAGAASGNKAEESPAGTWIGQGAADLWFQVKTSPIHHSVAGEKFRGITHDIVYDTELLGPFNEAADETLFWGSSYTYDTLLGGPFVVGEYVTFETGGLGGASVNGGKVLSNSGTILVISLENTTGGLVVNNDGIRGITSGATALVNVTITNDTKAGGEGILLALQDDGLTGRVYLQLISGQAPVDNLLMEGRTSGATALMNVTIFSRTIAPEFIGATTGTNIIGAYGIGFEIADVGSSDKFFDLANALRTPQNNVTFTVTGVVSGEDRVLVGPRTGAALNEAQMTLLTTLSGVAEVAIVATAAIPTGTPSQGNTNNTRLRVQLDTGINKRQPYLSFAGSTFTIAATDYSGANIATNPRNLFIAYIDVLANATSEAYTAVYASDVSILVRVRDGGGTPIKTFETSATFGSTSSSVAAIRTTDA